MELITELIVGRYYRANWIPIEAMILEFNKDVVRIQYMTGHKRTFSVESFINQFTLIEEKD